MSSEGWFLMPEVVLHIENDGAAYLRNPGKREYEMTWAQACKQYPVAARILLDEMAKECDANELWI